MANSNHGKSDPAVSKPTAGIVIIGDEILKGHTRDTNSHYLCQRLYSLGVRVKKISVVGDEEDEIADEIAAFSSKYTYVFTSGGVGPTHDDVTYAGVAKAFRAKLVANLELTKLFAKCENAEAMKMAMVPDTSVVNYLTNRSTGEKYFFPVISIRNVYIFPGIPQFLETAFECLEDLFHNSESQFYLLEMYLNHEELVITPILNKAVEIFKDRVVFGSYPEIDHSYYKVKLTLESDSKDQVRSAYAYLQEQLPPCSVVYYEKDAIAKAVDQVYGLISNSADNALTKAVKHTIALIEDTFKTYSLSEVCLSFNGGKDCTALLHLVHAAMKKVFPKNAEPLNALYIHCSASFPEVEQFIQQTASRYQLKLHVQEENIKSGLEKFLKENPSVKVMLLGSRRSDPHMSNVQYLQVTDKEWPQVLRAHPLLDWSYSDVWMFLRQLCLPYCALYDYGYTSLGDVESTKPNEDLKYIGEDGRVQYKPAYMLENSSLEREGRL